MEDGGNLDSSEAYKYGYLAITSSHTFAKKLNIAAAYEIGSQDAEESELRIKANHTF